MVLAPHRNPPPGEGNGPGHRELWVSDLGRLHGGAWPARTERRTKPLLSALRDTQRRDRVDQRRASPRPSCRWRWARGRSGWPSARPPRERSGPPVGARWRAAAGCRRAGRAPSRSARRTPGAGRGRAPRCAGRRRAAGRGRPWAPGRRLAPSSSTSRCCRSTRRRVRWLSRESAARRTAAGGSIPAEITATGVAGLVRSVEDMNQSDHHDRDHRGLLRPLHRLPHRRRPRRPGRHLPLPGPGRVAARAVWRSPTRSRPGTSSPRAGRSTTPAGSTAYARGTSSPTSRCRASGSAGWCWRTSTATASRSTASATPTRWSPARTAPPDRRHHPAGRVARPTEHRVSGPVRRPACPRTRSVEPWLRHGF